MISLICETILKSIAIICFAVVCCWFVSSMSQADIEKARAKSFDARPR